MASSAPVCSPMPIICETMFGKTSEAFKGSTTDSPRSTPARTAGNMILEEAIGKVRAGVERGESVVEPLKASEVFPNMVSQMIGIGEQTGALDAMLGKIADFYEQEVDAAIASLLTLIEPVMIGFLGVTIGSIVIAMYLPLFSLIGKMANGGH